jgi:RNA polymerase primary sigma factor
MRQLKIIKQVTNRENLSLDKYLHEIGKMELITAEEEVDLARRIHKGDLNARDRLINANLRFVVSVTKQYQHQGLSLPDMINEGNLGLIKAAERFDETRGFKFISYAVWWIRQSILQAIAEQSRIVRLPLNRIWHIKKIKRITTVLEQKYEREPTTLEISKASELAPTNVKEAIQNTEWYISMDAPLVL